MMTPAEQLTMYSEIAAPVCGTPDDACCDESHCLKDGDLHCHCGSSYDMGEACIAWYEHHMREWLAERYGLLFEYDDRYDDAWCVKLYVLGTNKDPRIRSIFNAPTLFAALCRAVAATKENT